MPAELIPAGANCQPQRLVELALLLEKSLDGFPPELADAARRRDYVAKIASLAEIAEYREGNDLIGAIAVYANDWSSRRAFISYVAVDPNFRGRGIARTLLEVVLQRLRACGFEHAVLRVKKSNAAARSLYADAGFLVSEEADETVELSLRLVGQA